MNTCQLPADRLHAALGGALVIAARPRLCDGAAALVDVATSGAEGHPVAARVAVEARRPWPAAALCAAPHALGRGLGAVALDAPLSWRRRLGLGRGREQQWLVFDEDDTLVGWMIVLGVDGLRGLQRGHTLRVQALFEELRDAFVTAHRREAAAPIAGGFLVLEDGGRVLGRSPQLLGRADLCGPLARLCHAGGPRVAALPRATVVSTPVVGEDTTRWIAEVQPPEYLYRAPESVLTPAQRKVAERAASGATCAEISAALSASVETVRTHLREVYRRLEVRSRAELAQVLLTG